MKEFKIQILMFVLGISLPFVSQACGYHDPQQIRIGSLNWIYPNCLHVTGAIDDAQMAGELPITFEPERITARGPYREQLDAAAFDRTKQSLLDFAELMQQGDDSPFSMVLVETALWSRFPAKENTAGIDIDCGGPGEGEDCLVVVTGESVIMALVAGTHTFSDAVDSEFVKLYGTPEQINRFKAAYGNIRSKKLASEKVKNSRSS